MLRNLSKPMQYALIGGLLILAWLVASPILFPDAPHKSTTKPLAKKAKKSDSLYLAEDYKPPKFTPVSATMKNSFKPLVVKTGTVGRSGFASATVNVVPPQFAGGESNWMYTGTAQVDGVLQALLENKTTGEDVFLRVGDTWKGISVEEITDDSLVLALPDSGLETTLHLPTDDLTGPIGSGSGFAPAQVSNPPLNGSIGSLTAQPDPNATQDSFTSQGNNVGNNGGRESGRRGRRRGGFQGTGATMGGL